MKYFPSHLLDIRVDFLKLFVAVLLCVGFEHGVLIHDRLHKMPE
jgi:hypothetical protein